MEHRTLARHDLVDIASADWVNACAAWLPCRDPTPEQAATIGGWATAGWPAIVRRPTTGQAAAEIAVGVPLPPSLGKLRVPLSLSADAAWRRRAPVFLDEASGIIPEWRTTTDALAALGRALDLRPRVFGGLLWQHVTGLQYLHPRSDLDLLWEITDPAAVDHLLAALRSIDEQAAVRIDGELLTTAGGVQWRELAGAWEGNGPVLAKTLDGAALVPAETLFRCEDVRC